MCDRVRKCAAVAFLACGAGALAQPWPPVPAVPDAEPTYTIRTAGQSERTVRVVRQPLDADGMAEVMDTATKQTFMIPGKVLAKLPRAGGATLQPTQPLVAKAEPKPEPIQKVEHTTPAEPPKPTQPRPKVEHTPPPAKVEPPAPEPLKSVVPSVEPKPIPAVKAEPSPWWKDGEPLKPVSPVVEVTRPLQPLAADRWRSTVGPVQAPAAPQSLLPVRSWKPGVPTTPPNPNDPWRSGN